MDNSGKNVHGQNNIDRLIGNDMAFIKQIYTTKIVKEYI